MNKSHNENVDPAALLVAVLAVGVGPLTQPGLWTLLSAMIALTVLVVVVAYGWPSKGQSVSSRQLFATAWVISFLVGQALAWPFQELVVSWGRDSVEGRDDVVTSIVAVVFGWVLTWPMFVWMRRTVGDDDQTLLTHGGATDAPAVDQDGAE